jgi:hypothetical protein
MLGQDQFAAIENGSNDALTSDRQPLRVRESDGAVMPTIEQMQSGNYRKGEVYLYGLRLAIENPRHTFRWGLADGRRWESRVAAHYGYIRGTRGNDGDEVDCFVGPYPESQSAWVINQTDGQGGFDEHKVMLAFPDERAARSAYQLSYERGWNRGKHMVQVDLPQLRWWLRHGNKTQPMRPDQLPDTGTEKLMDRVIWDSAALPVRTTLAAVMYAMRRDDAQDDAMLEPADFASMIDEEGGTVATMDAMVVMVGRLKMQMDKLQRVLEMAGTTVKPVAYQISDPVRKNGVLNLAVIFEMSDGQTVSIWFNNPDTTPTKLAPTDDLISWKWLLNKKDATIVVAPERGTELNIREVARRIMRLVEKNSAKFQQANAARAGKLAEIAGLESQVETLTAELTGLQQQIEVAKAEQVDRQELKAGENLIYKGRLIYGINIKSDGQKKVMYAIQTEDNKARAERGERTIGGDDLRDTLAEAKRLIDQEQALAEENAKYRAKEAERQAEIDRKKAIRIAEYSDVDGFADGMSAMQKARVLAALNEQILDKNGARQTRKSLIRERVAAGWYVEKSSSNGVILTDGDLFLDAKRITKTAIDYAAFLIAKKGKSEIADDLAADIDAFAKQTQSMSVDGLNGTDFFKTRIVQAPRALYTVKSIQQAIESYDCQVAWDVAVSARMDSAMLICEADDLDADDFDVASEWLVTPEMSEAGGDLNQSVLDGDFRGHPFRGNQYKAGSHESRGAVHASMRAKHAERKKGNKNSRKAHHVAHFAHRAAAITASGATRRYHTKMAKFHGQRAGVRMDSVVLDDTTSFGGGDIVGTITKDGNVIGRAEVGTPDGIAMIFVGEAGNERVKIDGTPALWGEDPYRLVAGLMQTVLGTKSKNQPAEYKFPDIDAEAQALIDVSFNSVDGYGAYKTAFKIDIAIHHKSSALIPMSVAWTATDVLPVAQSLDDAGLFPELGGKGYLLGKIQSDIGKKPLIATVTIRSDGMAWFEPNPELMWFNDLNDDPEGRAMQVWTDDLDTAVDTVQFLNADNADETETEEERAAKLRAENAEEARKQNELAAKANATAVHLKTLNDVISHAYDSKPLSFILDLIDKAITAIDAAGFLSGKNDEIASQAITHWAYLDQKANG